LPDVVCWIANSSSASIVVTLTFIDLGILQSCLEPETVERNPERHKM
jgi:hypothetical protein